jgi:hypothetical protein
MVDNGAPDIAPASLNIMGENIEVIADADPNEFPGGIEVILCKPGDLAPLAKLLVLPGRMVAVLPLGMSKQLRVLVKQSRTLHPGQVDAPGVKK